MRKLNYLFASLIMAAAFSSCDKEMLDKSELDLLSEKKAKKEAVTKKSASSPVSVSGVIPYIIPGANRGGNRTCAEVGTAFKGDADYFDFCGDKIDYEDGEFAGKFPAGLIVTVDGKFVSFETDGCLLIDGKNYKVGAVIVKGSADANVYFYSDGSTGDEGLAAPVNASGGPAGLSNLTFCFVECDEEPEQLVIAVKAFYRMDDSYYPYEAGKYSATLSEGEYLFTGSGCSWLGFNKYPDVTTFAMMDLYYRTNVGTVTVEEELNSLKVTVKLIGNGELDVTRLFVGTMAELQSTVSGDCPDHHNPLWITDNTDSNSITFTVPY